MDEEHLVNQVRHLQEVEGLSIRQVADALGLSRTKVTRLIRQGKILRKPRKSILDEYERTKEQRDAVNLLTYSLTGAGNQVMQAHA